MPPRTQSSFIYISRKIERESRKRVGSKSYSGPSAGAYLSGLESRVGEQGLQQGVHLCILGGGGQPDSPVVIRTGPVQPACFDSGGVGGWG